ncbi:Myosin type-2 heavy chain 1 [Wickerhamiella sorbophila]|uniref:Myosin type-2 heavy chain 1 n=1 Tax=Wickerhamiella sorbophila TaxID=45607 RepID=A0A2T0FIL8_9ASCO|nr:Myosin type-2 heavy chain 1 [Wickerhamiella sorbophila]PRT54838.1 Myosin type-2 heavy chain 1 [Wickerhamiella sorbophila]
MSDSKWVWIPDKASTFAMAELIKEEGSVATVKGPSGTLEELPLAQIDKVNPAQFDRANDIAELTFLNEASVLHNLSARYSHDEIYTYSGLFLVAVNPYKNIPIYDEEAIKKYEAKRREEAAPHIYSISDVAYRQLLQTKHDQSILITGESGAGKTENTKRVIQYLSAITSKNNLDGIDKRILETNPVLESFGNAQTVRNNNSSRFGKFVRIEFSDAGAICGASIEWYLLEKSRVITQSAAERNYHIFYQLLSGASSNLKDKLLISHTEKPADFAYLAKSAHSIDGVDDAHDFKRLLEAFKTVGMSEDETNAIFVIVAAVLHLGNIEFKNESSDQGRFGNAAQVEKVCKLLGLSPDLFTKAVLKPKILAGREEVVQARSSTQAKLSIDALSKSLYERLFGHLVSLLNAKLKGGAQNATSFIGVLDIAGFEIFDTNSFEQLCINYTNEKLQQFFNHHMFVLEQEEYVAEKIEWDYVDYGADLQPTINLIEKTNPMGIFSCLDEDSVMPRATDATFTDKLAERWKDKNPKFQPSRLAKGFVVSHYAGDVEYQTDGWLEKNKDPLSEPITELLQVSSNKLVKLLFAQAPTSESASRRRNSMLRTVAQRHKEQLSHLMSTLSKTNPHFVRCIIPNKEKKPGKLLNALVLDQLRCNGVLEGIRIARSGFPNRLDFADFRARYQPLAENPDRFEYVDGQRACSMILKDLNFDTSLYKVGLSKVFFRNGVLAELESRRDDLIKEKLTAIQSIIRAKSARKLYERSLFRRNAAEIIAKTFKTYSANVDDPWWQMLASMRPLLTSATSLEANRRDMRIQKLEETLQKLRQEHQEFEKMSSSKATALVGENDSLRGEKAKLEEKLEKASKKQKMLADQLKEGAVMIQTLSARPEQDQLDSIQKKYNDLDSVHQKLVSDHKELEIDIKRLNTQISELHVAHSDALAERDNRLSLLEKELAALRGDSKALACLKAELETAKAAIDERTKALAQQKETQKSELTKVAELHQGELQGLTASHQTAMGLLAKEHAEAVEKLKEQHLAEMNKLQTLLKEQEESHSKATATLMESHEAKLAEAVASASANKSIENELVQVKNQLDEVCGKLATAEKEASSSKCKLLSLNQNLADKENTLARVKTNAGRAANELLAAHKEIEDLKKASADISELEAIKASKKQLEMDLHIATVELETYRKNTKTESTKLKLDKQRLEKEVENLRIGFNQQSNLKRDLDRKSARIGLVDDLEQTNADLEIETNQVRADLANAKQEIQSLRKELAQAAVYKQRLEKVQREKAAAMEANSRLMFSAQNNSNIPKELELERAKASEAKKLQSEIKVLKLQLCKSERERKVAEARYPEAQLLAERNHAVRSNLDLQEKVKQLEFDKAQLKDQLTMIRPSSTERKSSLKLQRELKYAQNEIDSLKSEQRGGNLHVPKQRALRTMSGNEQHSGSRKLPVIPSSEDHIQADLEVYLETQISRNKELSESVELYKKRSEEFRNKLEGVEVIVRQAQLAEESAKKQLLEQRRKAAAMEADYESELKVVQSGIDQLRKELAARQIEPASKDTITALTPEQALAMKTTVDELTAERERLLADKQRLEKRVTELGVPRGPTGQNMVSQLQEKLLATQNDWKTQQRYANDLRWQVERKEKLVEKLRSTIAEGDMNSEQLREKIDELEANDAAREVAMRRAIREANEAREQKLRLEKELENLKTRMELSRNASRVSRASVASKSGFVFV